MEVTVKYLRPAEKTGTLHYRRVFPAPLRPHIAALIGKPLTELKVSLGAKDISAPGAMQRYQDTHARYERLVAQARKVAAGTFDPLDAPTIGYLIGKYRADHLTVEEAVGWEPEARAAGELLAQAAERVGYDLADAPEGARWSQGRRIAHQTFLEVAKGFRVSRDMDALVSAWSEQAGTLASESGYVVDTTSTAFRDLCRALNDTAVVTHEEALRLLDGQVVPIPPAPTAPIRHSKATKAGQTVKEIMLELIDKPRLNFKEPTKERVRGGLRFLVEAVGDLRPGELTRERVTVFLDLLAQRPAKLPKEDFRLALPKLAARYADRADVPRLTQKTQEAYILALNARWKEAQAEGAIPQALPSPFSDRKFHREGNGHKAAIGFNPEELTAYFGLPVFTEDDRPTRGKGEAVYWLPLLLLFTGARPEEVAQLLVTDIFQRERDNRWMIRFTNEGMHPVKGQQSLKTDGHNSGRRTFPIPQPLLDLGLLAYRACLQDQGDLALFPLLRRKGKRTGIYASFGEWVCDYIYDHGVLKRGAGRQPVREFRHTFSTATRASGIPKEARMYMQGHKDSADRSASDTYGQFEDLGDRIEELQFRVDILALVKPWQAPVGDGD
jgi:integrase